MKKYRSLVINLTLLIGTIIFFFICFEIAARVLHLNNGSFVQSDLCTGYKSIPNMTGYQVSPDYVNKVTMNDAGFHDVDHSLQKDSRYRILFLGDSYTEALQVPLQETIARKVQEKLGSTTVETISLGVSGYGTDQEYLMLKCYGLAYKPDLVVMDFFTGNDVDDNNFRTDPRLPKFSYASSTLTLDTSYQQFLSEKPTVVHAVLAWIKHSSEAVTFIYNKFETIKALHQATVAQNQNEIYQTPMSTKWQQAWQLTEALILATKNLATENNTKFILMQIPAVEQIKGTIDDPRWPGTYDVEQPNKILANFTASKNINYLDLLPYFTQKIGNDYTQVSFPHDAHWNAYGHTLGADALTDYIKNKKFIVE